VETKSKLERITEEACARYGLRNDDRFLVRSLLRRPQNAWPACCGSGCATCMDDVVAAAMYILEHTTEEERTGKQSASASDSERVASGEKSGPSGLPQRRA